MSVAIGYVPGAYGQGGDDPDFLRRLVELGDKYGYDSIWLSDRIVSDRFSLEPMVALSMVAAWSDRMKFGTSVLALPLRNPVVLAKQIATLDFLSQGRCFPAVGLGGEEIEEYEACGVPKEDRSRRTDEAIVLMRRLWEEDNVTHEGQFFTCHNVSITPKTCFQPSPPVWIGGRSPAAARRVGRVGDGWLVSGATAGKKSAGAGTLCLRRRPSTSGRLRKTTSGCCWATTSAPTGTRPLPKATATLPATARTPTSPSTAPWATWTRSAR